MEYVYAAMLLHASGSEIDDGSVTKVLEAAGISVDASRVKALVASLSGIDIDEAKSQAIAAPAAAAPAAAGETTAVEETAEEPEEEEEEEAAFEGLGSLFG